MSKKKTYEGVCLQELQAGDKFISEKSPAQIASTAIHYKRKLDSTRLTATCLVDGELFAKYFWEYTIISEEEVSSLEFDV